ncbi:dipicolinate synthase subunit B [Carboxydothermus hydrogenoformans]|uniref:Dipicolinate synthase, B subunit n=1 Tax=Carboxydothermus hydrogenoformans (strain ATCC BAA-161 / DSM 6008 / Z-2901) TaxID=246194 RepID=Q3ACY6_CARHZ|nr:dipicolinate synthase subunit B [Carboxydothermus hydrogenoformans]ABB13850.1 dipicolinate synthase, B subunit [Carboxydothermus hydrogenoformans Z-2901]
MIKVGFAFTGSHCTLPGLLGVLEKLAGKFDITPIFSESVQNTISRFGDGKEFMQKVESITGKKGITTLTEAEPIGPQKLFDVLVIAPCTGNTMAKLANGITDSVVLMAAKAHLRNQKPLILAISTNDALGMNAKNLGLLLNAKNIFFVPFGQDNPKDKPNSLIANLNYLEDTINEALKGRQIQPMLITYS